MGIPWKGFIFNRSAFACYFCNFAFNWGNGLLITYLPTYMKTMFDLRTNIASYLSMSPFILMFITCLVGEILCKHLIEKGYKYL